MTSETWTGPLATADKPQYVQLRSGRWFWEPPLRLRKAHGLTTKALGADQPSAWAYARKLNAEVAAMGPGAGSPGTIQWVFNQFFASDKFKGLAAVTQRDYRWVARMFDDLLINGISTGSRQARSIKARHADGIYDALKKKHGPSGAHYAARVARRVWKWAARKEMVDEHIPNPWAGMELAAAKPRDQLWTPEQVSAVIAASLEIKRPSVGLAVLLAYWFGHRQGDVLGLRWTDLDAQIRETSKTGRKVPVVAEAYPELAKALEDERERQRATDLQMDRVLICEATGLPWNRWTFGHTFRQAADKAGIPKTLQYRDLRATAQTELADNGASIIEMRTHSGHATVAMAGRYARPTVEQFKQGAAKRIAGRKKT